MIISKKGGRPQKWYNLDAIISIGYRINSKEATHFHQFITEFITSFILS
ncbi:RhuM family protein [Methanobrevibacter sp.]